jgi:hypothetical protein
VVETLCIEIDDIPISAFMFGMALFTVCDSLLLQSAVKPSSLFDIFSHITVVVTGKTSLNLIGFFQRLMTAFAFLFKLGMAFDDRPRHQQ